MTNQVLHGSCLCRAVRWEVEGPLAAPDPADPFAPLAMSHCHCSRCRKAHGAAYATYLSAPAERFRITAGREATVSYASSEALQRPFCGICGSVVADGLAWNGIVGMPAGSLDEDPGLRPASHIFVGSKASWVTVPEDGLLRFDGYPDVIPTPPIPTRPALDADTGHPRGSCLCGGVAYRLTQAPVRCMRCHCSRCRKATAAAHASNMLLPVDGLDFTRGEELVVTYKLPEAKLFGQSFCRVCGSTMPRRVEGRPFALVPMGSLDDDPGVRPQAHIWVGSRAAWDFIGEDGLPRFEEGPPPV